VFSYYGSKSKIVKRYPKPIHNTIIEPFAGSARYALEYWEKEVILIDKYEPIYNVWKYLQNASKEDILSLPEIPPSTELMTIDGFKNLSSPEKNLIGFCSNRGSNMPKNFSGKFCNFDRDKKRISESLHKIKHWDIRIGDYHDVENLKSTWYIDPPYEKMGKLYKESNIDYEDLSNYCKTRNGQVIVCENDGATWLDFKPLVELAGQRKMSKEVFWYKENN